MTEPTHSLRLPPARRLLALVLLALALAVPIAGCGSSSSSSAGAGGSGDSSSVSSTGATSSHIALAKTKFVIHSALAFGAFHRYIYKPVRRGDLRHPFSHKLALIKAGLAAAFVYHELKIALKDAQSSPTLSKLVSPITALQMKFAGLDGKLRNGSADPSTINQANGEIGSIHKQAASAGQPIAESAPAL